jgi:hypothetical protein
MLWLHWLTILDAEKKKLQLENEAGPGMRECIHYFVYRSQASGTGEHPTHPKLTL